MYRVEEFKLKEYLAYNESDYKDELVYSFFNKYYKLKKLYDIKKVRKHIDNSIKFLELNDMKQKKNIEFWLETEFFLGFGWFFEENKEMQWLRDVIDFKKIKYGELDFTFEYGDFISGLHDELAENDYFYINSIDFEYFNENEFYEKFKFLNNYIFKDNDLNRKINNIKSEREFIYFLRNDSSELRVQ